MMNWTVHKWYMVSNNGYHIAKSGRIPMHIKYIAYCPRKTIIKGSPFFSAKEAIEACNEYHKELIFR